MIVFILLLTFFFLIVGIRVMSLRKAVCVFNENNVKGTIYLEEIDGNKTHIYGKITGLTKGKHGFHIHEFGDLTDGCKSLGAHYNPFGHSHSGLQSKKRHIGDLGNVIANKNGIANINITDNLIKLRGKYSVIGRSFVVHEDEDDLGLGHHKDSKTTGHAGARLACGVIGFASNH